MLEEVAAKMIGSVDVFAMDVGATHVYADFSVTRIPTLIFFKNGAEAGRLVGTAKKEKIMEEVKNLL